MTQLHNVGDPIPYKVLLHILIAKSGYDKLHDNFYEKSHCIDMQHCEGIDKQKHYYCLSADKNAFVRPLLDLGNVYLWLSQLYTNSSTVGGKIKKLEVSTFNLELPSLYQYKDNSLHTSLL